MRRGAGGEIVVYPCFIPNLFRSQFHLIVDSNLQPSPHIYNKYNDRTPTHVIPPHLDAKSDTRQEGSPILTVLAKTVEVRYGKK